MVKDQIIISKRLKKKLLSTKEIDQLAKRLEKSIKAVKQKQQSCPKITLNQKLPIVEKQKEVIKLLENNQVIIVCGETGSGKTTQLPQICLKSGLGIKGKIAHTQPRRLAARTVADRISEELKQPLGTAVGYKIRFHDKPVNNHI